MFSKNCKILEVLRRIFYNDSVEGQVFLNNGNISGLSDQSNTFASNKLARINAIHVKWDLEDLENPSLEVKLKTCQKIWCKAMEIIMFNFSL